MNIKTRMHKQYIIEMSTSTNMEQSSQETPMVKHIGRVKWFNNVSGYGFITVTDGERSGTDVFVHHTSIVVKSSQYKYLVQGEYVSFGLANIVKDGKDALNAVEVSGIGGGILMCETRQSVKETRASHTPAPTENVPTSPKKQSKERRVEKGDSTEKKTPSKKTTPSK